MGTFHVPAAIPINRGGDAAPTSTVSATELIAMAQQAPTHNGQCPIDIAELKAWLKGFSTPLAIAIEATNCYHEVLVEAAIAAGHVVYLIDPRKLHHYREATGGRAKTDR